MRFAEPLWQWWEQMMAEITPPPQAEPNALSAWEATQAFIRTRRQVDQMRHQHRRVKHQHRRR
jgi:hypothetical protein